MFINPEAVQTLFGGFYGGVITQAQLIKSLAVGDGFNQKPFCLSQTWSGEEAGQGRDRKFQSSNHVLDRMWSTGEGNGKPLQYSCLENPMNSMKRQNDRILKEELLRSVGAQYATGDQWRNNSRKNEGMEPK